MKPKEIIMAKPIPVRSAKARPTPAGAIEICFTSLSGKDTTIAVMPSYLGQLRRLIDEMEGNPQPISTRPLRPELQQILRDAVVDMPRQSGGYRLLAQPDADISYLQILQSDGGFAEIPMNAHMMSRLIDDLQRATLAVGPVAGNS